MPIEIKVPALGESITEALIAAWLKPVGAVVAIDEPLVELETDKITVEVPAPVAGVLSRQSAEEGATVEIGDVIGIIDPAGAAAEATPTATTTASTRAKSEGGASPAMPSARALARRSGIDLDTVEGSGRGGRILKEDVQEAAKARSAASKPAPAIAPKPAAAPPPPPPPAAQSFDFPDDELVKMSPLRRRIAERLIESQQTTASLTTFNEIDMSAIFKLRSAYKGRFTDVHGVKLGFMSFFIKAACVALKEFPGVNAEIRGESILYKKRYNIGVAVGGGKGLVVPVIRDADRLSFAAIEQTIGHLARRARDNKLTLDDLVGGSFTISNGGIYGSMLSTPILNPPQTGILGLHNIVQRPVAVDGKVEIRPVMYLALTYDHRVVDGREAVQFLVRVKECVEHPERMLLEV
ncbi:MAG TPA: 2-oxoglutarate dehydrogenase complex dihydrolipoyllysine-residue succinyltransferase [Nannocystis exedens]|nr:2-oxoglutarate dehydrogenase complex dihydrolipoyllysine-residue succinyltransferase [Nannocystis exedens]